MANKPASKVLLILGNEICHNYFANYLIGYCPECSFDVIKFHSLKPDFEYFYPFYSNAYKDTLQREHVVRFIFQRNKTLAIEEEYGLLASIPGEQVFSSEDEFNHKLAELVQANDYALYLSYGAPIIRNYTILNSQKKAFNLHFGLSKFYRGGDANIFALSRGYFDKVGLTCHELTEKVDEGLILFEIQEVDYSKVKNLDGLRYELITSATKRVSKIIKRGSYLQTYRVARGELVLNSDMTASIVVAAEEYIKAMHSNN